MKNGFDWGSHSGGLINLYGFIRCLCVRTLLWWAQGDNVVNTIFNWATPEFHVKKLDQPQLETIVIINIALLAQVKASQRDEYFQTWFYSNLEAKFHCCMTFESLRTIWKIFEKSDGPSAWLNASSRPQDWFLDELYKWNKPKTCEVKCEISTVL